MRENEEEGEEGEGKGEREGGKEDGNRPSTVYGLKVALPWMDAAPTASQSAQASCGIVAYLSTRSIR